MPLFSSLKSVRLTITLTAVFSVFLISLTVTVMSADKDESKPKVDYSSEMPRILPRTPEEALKSFKLHDDFQIELVAAEPLVRDPVAMCFDERGRAYVVEMPEYNDANKEGYSAVKLLEDTNGDGTYDKSFPFLTDMTLPTAVFSYKGACLSEHRLISITAKTRTAIAKPTSAKS